MTAPLSIVILAAGAGTRMRSALPKVLHPVAGRPMLARVIDAAAALGPDDIHIIYGHGGERVRNALADADVRWVEQAERLGTGHAVGQAIPDIDDRHRVLVLCGDTPLITAATLQRLCETAGEGAALLTAHPVDPAGYGRILRDADGAVAGIVEEKDADAAQRAIGEVNTGVMCLPAGHLRGWLDRLTADNAQGEYYLTDVIALARADGVPVAGVATADEGEVLGVNSRAQLATVERLWQRREADRLMAGGVTLLDPARFDVRGELQCGQDVTIDVNCQFIGEVSLGNGTVIGPNCTITDSQIGEGVKIAANSVIEGAVIAGSAHVGPFARLRPGTVLARGAKVGNFVETKNAGVGEGAKINHLSYVGDAEVGADANIGAGTITCNYDGANKHRTVIGEDAFIGSNTALVAPVRIGRGATIGAGSVIRDDAPEDSLTLTGIPQKSVPGWRRPRRDDD
ncbi:Bifunctional protein GlmU [wastewater metagenome]|uniref:Bifunctional protein GlmU n=2 Tax=unclassified sequences TaxID=12908 RepID=A0A5B8RII9_9ZZZZ|nr:bifunctional UDP-N-acetylglucosamine diphosphorylase/glucosamine-1-phosphate N-acetyltransferase GlmU [Arhodomonas sp. KWT]QEA07502.1 bifunctional protein GlmU [uncultured organism]